MLRRLLIPAYRCPSCSEDAFEDFQYSNNPERTLVVNYAGISGAARPVPGLDPNFGTKDCGHGWGCNNGMLAPNESFKLAACTDGTSNTMLLGEQSSIIQPSATQAPQTLSSNYYGGWYGSRHPRPTLDANCGDLWQTGTTCIRYAINLKIAAIGAERPYRSNTVLNSRHPGGVNVCLTDGSVRFVAETIDFDNLKRMACRRDGMPVTID